MIFFSDLHKFDRWACLLLFSSDDEHRSTLCSLSITSFRESYSSISWKLPLLLQDDGYFLSQLFIWSSDNMQYHVAAATAVKSHQLCPTLCNPIDGSPTGSSVPGILQARILEWVAISFSNEWKRKVKVKSLSRVWLLATPWIIAYQATRLLHPWDSRGKSIGVGCHCLLHAISC